MTSFNLQARSPSSGLRGSPVSAACNISKAADFQLARNLAVEFGPPNVRVWPSSSASAEFA